MPRQQLNSKRPCFWLHLHLQSLLQMLDCALLKQSRYSSVTHRDKFSCNPVLSALHRLECCMCLDQLKLLLLLLPSTPSPLCSASSVGICIHIATSSPKLHTRRPDMSLCLLTICQGRRYKKSLLQVKIQTSPGYAKGLTDGLPKFVQQNGAAG